MGGRGWCSSTGRDLEAREMNGGGGGGVTLSDVVRAPARPTTDRLNRSIRRKFVEISVLTW